MKTILAVFAATILFVGCNDDKPKNQVLDPLAKISIRADVDKASAAPTRADYPTPLEVVQKTTDIVLSNPKIGIQPSYNFGISDEQKDIAIPKIMMWGMWVIENDALSPTFIEAHDVIFVKSELIDGDWHFTDTLAYIPNAQLSAAEVAIKAAYAVENYDEVYRLFDEAYKFTPINGTDWLKLKEKGEN